MKKFLPDPPSAQAINAAIEELRRLRKSYLRDEISFRICCCFV
jgi:hypothetical protein